jgi:hypothetical protein
MKNIVKILIISTLTNFLFQYCGLPTSQEIGLKFSTEKSAIPESLSWREIGLAKEMFNQKEKIVVISGGDNPIPLDRWEGFKPSFPWKKNIDRHLLFRKTCFYRSPGTNVNCTGPGCFHQREYKGYSWIELAEPVCIDFIPDRTDILKPAIGHLVIKTIKKAQALMFTDSIYQLTDNRGNFYVMHAFENNGPDTTAALPEGWTLRKVFLTEPLIVSPFGGGNECYFNIVGDNLGQGYHQYIFADKYYPSHP